MAVLSLRPQSSGDNWFYPENMQNKRRTKRNPKASKPKKTPFADVGAIVGSSVGKMFHLPYAAGVGKWLGSGIGSIFGSGDYTLTGEPPSYNVLTSSKQIPKFSTTSATNIICHREYLGDIKGTAAFTNRSFPLNPGIDETFPWLSSIAESYQEYRFHGLIFEFRPMITDFVTGGSPGTVVMATNYNADSTVYISKQQMESSEYAVSVKPTLPLIHGIECATKQTILPQRYVRTTLPPSGQDKRLYDTGTFQLATTNNPVDVVLGELWVSYCVEFFKPILPTSVGGSSGSAHSTRTASTSGQLLGSVPVFTSSNVDGLNINPNFMSWRAQPGSKWLLTVTQQPGTAAVIVYPTVSTTNCVITGYFNAGTSGVNLTPNAGTNTDEFTAQVCVVATTAIEDTVSVQFTGGVFPTAFVDVILNQVDSSI